MKILLLTFLFSSTVLFAQNPDPAFNPVTAPGAIGVDWNQQHTLFWVNPLGVQYNECYFSCNSLLVANLDSAVRIQNGYPSNVNSEVSLNSLVHSTQYYWRIVEYNSSGNSLSLL
jgi:hypothetical protein